MKRKPRRAGIVVAAFVAVVAVALIMSPDSNNLPTDSTHTIQAQPGTSDALAAVLNRSCGDCHSNTMVSRWYTRVPPLSTLMARGAREGRNAVNFSEWTGYSPAQQRALLVASCSAVKRGTMPVKAYLSFRRDARLSPDDLETICSAARDSMLAPASTALQARRGP